MTETPRSLTAAPQVDADRGLLRAALEGLRVQGSIFLRAEFTEDWAYASPPSADMAAMLKAEWNQLVLFHIVAHGTCWVALADGERHWAQRGDVIVLPYGDAHQVGGPTDADVVPIADLLAPPPWDAFPMIRYGGGGGATEIVCGYLEADDPSSILGCGRCRPCSSCGHPVRRR
ncbi:MAG TPA: cupin domain-containing protein, partial [Euzebya sp.]|nr:cupin domain-containing protein [Euzebya sp.]